MCRMRSGKGVQQGYFYVSLLLFVVLVGISLTAVSELWSLRAQREREEELLFVGQQYRQAITHYYATSPKGAFRFPHSLQDLLDDDRDPNRRGHHLRRLYPDPMTGRSDWGEVTLADGSIVGVYSRSLERPQKQKGFLSRDQSFEEQSRYADWIFRSPLPAANPALGGNGYNSTGATPSGASPIVPNGPIRGTPGTQPTNGLNRPILGR